MTALAQRLRAVKTGSRAWRTASPAKKNRVLSGLSKLLIERAAEILAANARDLRALPASTPSAFRERLTLNPARIQQMAESLRQVRALPDPVGEVAESRVLGNGLRVRRERAPLGVTFMIYESRPNVAIEAFSVALKSGNALILRGGKEARFTVSALYGLCDRALKRAGLDPRGFWGIRDPDRALVAELLKARESIDVVVPRGGEGLIGYVTENSRIPVIKNDRGLCHVYVHADFGSAADLARAVDIVLNAKTQRPSVCNAMETLLVHRRVAARLLAKLGPELRARGVEIFADPAARRAFAQAGVRAKRASAKSWDTEYLELKLNVGVVDSLESAIAHIDRHGSRHSEAILARSRSAARKFQAEVDAAAVYWNASTRFTDGFELGLGAELGISTQKLHVRGPIGPRELTSLRWVIDGKGQIRK